MATVTELDRRVAVLRAELAERGLAAAVLASPESIYYLTGFDHLGYFAFTALVVPPSGPPVIVNRAMERPIMQAQVPQCEHRPFHDGEDPAAVLTSVLADLLPANCTAGIEQRAMYFPPAVYAAVVAARPDVGWQDVGELLGRTMAVKSSAELELMRRASAVSDAAMAAGIAAARPGVAEARVAAEIHHAMFSHGGMQPGFDPLVRPLSLLTHEHMSWADGRVLEPDSGVFFELSGCVRRYHAPQARTVYIGRPPPGAADAHAAALAGLTAAEQALGPGVPTGDVYAAWRAAAGVQVDRHHCGYQVGIGFPPSWIGGEPVGIRPGEQRLLEAGMTFHLQSWVPGYTMSETVVVTPNGCDVLTTTTRELLVLSR
jgi:Xaa-Pro dipeptidase